MKHKHELKTALVCFGLILAFVVGMRAGLHDEKLRAEERTDEVVAAAIAPYTERIAALEAELAAEREIEHVEIEYVPLPVDYESIGSIMPDEVDAVLLAKTMWGEYRDSSNYAQAASVCFCITNRAAAYGKSIAEIVKAPGQFHGYSDSNPVDAELYKIACSVLLWLEIEDLGVGYGRPIPTDYLWFEAAPGMVNTYRNAYQGGEHITP